MRHLDLFSGIGGFALAASWVWGDEHEIVYFVEIEPFCQKVLNKHWPNVPIHDDIRSFLCGSLDDVDAEVTTEEQVGTLKLARVDLLTGGFPCQDVSFAGPGGGLNGARSGLWKEMFRIIRILRPAYCIVENPAALLNRGMSIVLGDLAEIGYDAQWQVLPAASVGARHLRERVFIIAATRSLDYSDRFYPGSFKRFAPALRRWTEKTRIRSCFDRGAWAREPNVERVAYGIPDRPHRLKALGNAIVPQVVVPIMQEIKEIEQGLTSRST